MHAVYSVHFILYQYHSSFCWRLSPNDAVVTTPIGSILGPQLHRTVREDPLIKKNGFIILSIMTLVLYV